MMEKLQENGDKEAKLGSKAPVWIQDGRVSMCMLCTDKFTPVSNRRHHCRACGKVSCGMRDLACLLACTLLDLVMLGPPVHYYPNYL